MNKLTWAVAVTAAMTLSHVDRAGAATEHFSKTILVLEVNNGSPCYFFRLDGVAQADPVIASPWFAIPTSSANAKEMYAMLLSIRASGGPIYRVLTSGSAVCGGAEVATIDF